MSDDEFQKAVIDALEQTFAFMASRMQDLEGRQLAIARAAQAIALLCAADQMLVGMPVERAFEYREAAKDFTKKMEVLWAKADLADVNQPPPT